MERKIKIGSRGSKLALWQAQHVESLLIQQGYDTEIVVINTKGDKIHNKSIAKIGSKGVFTEALEEKLRSKEIDIAVHSAKDMQSNLDKDLALIAIMQREKVNDVVISYNKDFSLQHKHDLIVGTSSTRRVALLRHHYPHMRTSSVRGNLQTRLKRLEEGMCDALILAYAGVHRMHHDDLIVCELPVEQFTPPAGQGSIAIEVCTNLSKDLQKELRKILNDPISETCIIAERAFIRTLQGGCSVPVFAYAKFSEDQNTLNMTGGLTNFDGSKIIREFAEEKIKVGELAKAEKLGNNLANKVIDLGGADYLKEINDFVE